MTMNVIIWQGEGHKVTGHYHHIHVKGLPLKWKERLTRNQIELNSLLILDLNTCMCTQSCVR
jgi:hypothetical protein